MFIIMYFLCKKRIDELEEENKKLNKELKEFRCQRDIAKWKAWREKQKNNIV